MQMNCMNCGAPISGTSFCVHCGFDLTVQKKAYLLSNLYYNQGLEKAQIRDLSGAIDLLQRSLKFNKLNIQARNLLGLVYYEMGEAVSALSEWVISKNIMPENNIAAEYINRLQSNANKLDMINQTIKKYNEALMCCRSGSPDVAAIQLKKILTQNPKLIKAYHLLALIYIHQKEYEKARKILKKAAKIDKTNSTTLRFLSEVDEQTGTHTNLEGRWNFKRGKASEGIDPPVGAADVIIPPTFHESSVFSTILNMGFGLIIGILMVWFLFMPAKTERINREANEKVTEYSTKMASQSAEVIRMEEQIAQSEETVSSAKEQIEEAKAQVASYDNLLKARNAYAEGSYTNAANALGEVNRELLSVEAAAIYDDIYANIRSTMYKNYKTEGINAFDYGEYATAIDLLEKAKEIDDTDYEVLNYLAHAYRKNNDSAKAIENFELIIDQNPGTRRADSAQAYIEAIQSGADVVSAEGEVTQPEEDTGGESSEDTSEDTSDDEEDYEE